MNQIIKGDCLEVMRGLSDQSIGMVLADLPYAVTACSWDLIIDPPKMWAEFERLIQPDRAMVLTATQPFTSLLVSSNLKSFKYDWVWCKSRATDFVRAKLKPMGGHESVLVFSLASVANGAKQNMLYNPQGLYHVGKTCKNGGGGVGFIGRNKENLGPNNKLHQPTYTQEKAGYPNTKLFFDSEIGTTHPTQKPVALFEYLIRTYTNPGDVVLDPTAGSMTTAIAALNTGRGYICIEKDPDEYRKGLQRVEEHLAKPQQFNLLEPTPSLPAAATVQQTTIFDALSI